MIDMDNIGALLKQRRRNKGITQAEMAEHLGLSKNHVSDIERGIHKLTIQTFCGYCEMLETTPDEILDIRNRNNIIPELLNYLSDMNIDDQKKLLSIARMI